MAGRGIRVSPCEWVHYGCKRPDCDERIGNFLTAGSALVGCEILDSLCGTREVDQETDHTPLPLWVGSQGDSVACGWIKRHHHGGEHKEGGRGGHYHWICGNSGVVSQIRGMVYGPHAEVGSEACIQFCLWRSMPREAGEIPVSSCHESPVGQMPLTQGPKASSSDAKEHETESAPRLPFT